MSFSGDATKRAALQHRKASFRKLPQQTPGQVVTLTAVAKCGVHILTTCTHTLLL